ncbi:MAG: ABC transporter ATP-binding protein [Spirochaetae bacterium HGW-Spirochaetae-8]|jgi:ABC-type lipoprotein export system ATPase subunit|nr:MAG: ABC transporter ATP-binding protein [Spirochaetae bacterium HGW-Spirochaetae-8]
MSNGSQDLIATADELLRFRGVSKEYTSGEKRLLILDNIDLSIKRGMSVAITGKSGCGKSTMLNLAGGLDSPTLGSVMFLGKDLARMNDRELSDFRNRQVGFIFQSHVLLDDFSALENVCIPALIAGGTLRQARSRAASLLDRVGLSDRMTHHPQKLSGGERQRVAICRALMNNPSLVIADEPTGSLDEEASLQIENLLMDMVREQGKTLLMVTHDTQLAHTCASVYLLHNRNLEDIS